MKGNTRPKFIYIGLKLTEIILQSVLKQENSYLLNEQILGTIVSPQFLKIFVKNYQNNKGPLFDAASSIKNSLLQICKSQLTSK